MIKVERPSPADPAISPIITAGELARQALIDDYEGGKKPSIIEARYRAYKQALLAAFHGKCAYCDTFIDDNQHGHVEHYRPKNRVRNEDNSAIEVEYPKFGKVEHLGYFWLAYDWQNLLPACDLCNGRGSRDNIPFGKSDRFPVKHQRAHLPFGEAVEEPLLLDPTRQDPAGHLDFSLDGFLRGLTEEGECTIRLLGLNVRERLPRERVAAYHRAIDAFNRYMTRGIPREELLRLYTEINQIWAGDTEHSVYGRMGLEVVQSYYRDLGFAIPLPVPPPRQLD